jgi:hypothetical protein
MGDIDTIRQDENVNTGTFGSLPTGEKLNVIYNRQDRLLIQQDEILKFCEMMGMIFQSLGDNPMFSAMIPPGVREAFTEQ